MPSATISVPHLVKRVENHRVPKQNDGPCQWTHGERKQNFLQAARLWQRPRLEQHERVSVVAEVQEIIMHLVAAVEAEAQRE